MKQTPVMQQQSFKINDIYYTFQGEGRYAGRRALFIRLPFCNLACPWCDTEFNSFSIWSLDKLKDFIDGSEEKTKFCVLTGGEPSMNKQTRFIIDFLKDKNFEIAIESNGHFDIDSRIDFVTISPKEYMQVNSDKEPFYVCEDAWKKANEFKYVIYKNFNFDILDRHDVRDGRIYSLSPEFSDMSRQIIVIENYIKSHPGWKLNLQLHKWIDLD